MPFNDNACAILPFLACSFLSFLAYLRPLTSQYDPNRILIVAVFIQCFTLFDYQPILRCHVPLNPVLTLMDPDPLPHSFPLVCKKLLPKISFFHGLVLLFSWLLRWTFYFHFQLVQGILNLSKVFMVEGSTKKS